MVTITIVHNSKILFRRHIQKQTPHNQIPKNANTVASTLVTQCQGSNGKKGSERTQEDESKEKAEKTNFVELSVKIGASRLPWGEMTIVIPVLW